MQRVYEENEWGKVSICLQSLLSFCLSSVLRNFKNFIDIRKKKKPKTYVACASFSTILLEVCIEDFADR